MIEINDYMLEVLKIGADMWENWQKLEKIGSVLILMTLITISICKVSKLTRLKVSDNRYASFFAEENPIDVIFIGSSHVRYGFFPMELWKDYGLVSYNLGGMVTQYRYRTGCSLMP